jgi:hypothetical protein
MAMIQLSYRLHLAGQFGGGEHSAAGGQSA